MQLRTGTFMATLESFQKRHSPLTTLLTQESIAFQRNDSFGPALEVLLDKYKTMLDAGIKPSGLKKATHIKKDIEDLIKTRFGMKIELHIDSYLGAVIPNIFVATNPAIQDVERIFYDDWDSGAIKSTSALKTNTVMGSVDLERAKVSGWFSEQIVPLYANMSVLFSDLRLSTAEVASIIMHELGHAFEGVVLASNINTTNQILADVAKYITEKGERADVKYVYTRIRLMNPKATPDIAEGLMSGNATVMSAATFRLMVGSVETLMSDKTYDRTTFEVKADNFATRMGYGLPLITGLEALEKHYHSEYKMQSDLATGQIIGMVYGVITLITSVAVIFVGPAAIKAFAALMALIAGFLVWAIFTSMRITSKDMTYDNIRDRYTRIRNQLIESIKDPELNVTVKAKVLEQIKVTDRIISSKKVFSSTIEKLMIKFNNKDALAFNNIAAQQEMERMIANDIFIAATALSLKA